VSYGKLPAPFDKTIHSCQNSILHNKLKSGGRVGLYKISCLISCINRLLFLISANAADSLE